MVASYWLGVPLLPAAMIVLALVRGIRYLVRKDQELLERASQPPVSLEAVNAVLADVKRETEAETKPGSRPRPLVTEENGIRLHGDWARGDGGSP